MTLSTLRAVANRLIATPVDDLPHHAGYLATAISSCQDLLSSPNPNQEQAAALHKLKTRVSALLQDRTAEGRLVGIIIAKALIENGGKVVIAEASSWVRFIISSLSKPDEPEIKRLGVITLTRIYSLTLDHQTLVREVTTPTLPGFITASLSIVKPSNPTPTNNSKRALSPLLNVVLQSWTLLLPKFASTIRPSASTLKKVCLSLISDVGCPESTRSLASTTLALLPFCAPKNSAATEVNELVQQACESANDTADLCFRAVVEDWTSSSKRTIKVTKKQRSANSIQTQAPDVIGLDSWSGVSQGCARICSHVNILSRLLTCQHSHQVALPLANIFDLTGRLAALAPPTAAFSLRTNNEIPKEEREELWLALPRIHDAVLDLFISLIQCYAAILRPCVASMMSQVWDIFNAHNQYTDIRVSAYKFLLELLPLKMHKFEKSQYKGVTELMQTVYQDQLRVLPETTNGPSNGTLSLTTNTKNTKASGLSVGPQMRSVNIAAANIIPLLLADEALSEVAGYPGLRAQLESAAILTQNESAILAGTLHPNRRLKTSLLPFLARETSFSDRNISMAREALLRPRMPLISIKPSKKLNKDKDEDLQAQDEVGISHEEMAWEADHNDKQIPISASTQIAVDTEQSSGDPLATSKRDFTSLLEAATDEQLARSAAAQSTLPVSISMQNEDESPTKKPRLNVLQVVDPSKGVSPAEDHELVAQDTLPMDTDTTNNKEELASDVGLESPNSTEAVQRHNEDHGTDSDSSDSEIPAIDATLAGMTDSEDEA